MAGELSDENLREFMKQLGRSSRGPGAIFITGGGQPYFVRLVSFEAAYEQFSLG